MSAPLLAAKLRIPPSRPDWMERGRLEQRLDALLSPGYKLGLVCAPAGYGKTTLLSRWLKQKSLRVCWISLEPGDNDPGLFFANLSAGLGRAWPEQAALFQSIGQGAVLDPHAAIAGILALLEELSERLWIVLDDYHFISALGVQELMAYFLENLPEMVRLILLTRSDPPLALPRLRARNQMLELRAQDLRFNQPEMAAFFQQVMGLDLPEPDLSVLEARTEGWPAGLQMAGISMQGRQDISGFIQAFSGSHRFILDYLTAEVLKHQPPEVQDFLLKTAVLERLNAGVCDAVWQAGGREQPDSDAMIRYLEQANLFLVALDDERCWYRYHHLFADLLRARLRQLDPAVVKTLHRAAAAWYAQQAQAEGDRELASLAIQHALTSEDTRLATLIIEQNWGRWAEAGEIGRLLHWMQAIPRQEILNSPLLASSYAWTLFLRGQIADTLPAVLAAGQALEEALASGRFKPADLLTSIAQGMNLGLRSSLARLGGNLPEAVCLAEQALAVIPPGPNILRGIIYTSLAPALRDLGQYPQAVRVYRDSLSDLQSGSNLTAAASITYYLVQLYLLLGDVNQAEEICLASRRWLEQKRGERAPAAALIHIAWAEILYIHNHLEQALAAAHEGYNLGQKAGSLDAIKQGAIILSRLCQARSDTAQGLRCLDEAEMVNVQAKGSLTLADLQVARARLWVISGRWPEARQWAGQLEGRAVPPPAYIQLLEQAVQVRLLLALNQPEQALVQAQKLLTQTVAVEAHLLFVLALQAQGRSDEALKALSQVVETAAAHQAIRYFMDDGAALLPLLEVLENTATRRDLSVPARAFLQEVLLAVGAGRNKPALHPELVEMPSERELEVLRLMAEGLTNQEIAVRLVLAPNTIKAHTANIYRKLEAENRTQAVTRARELGLIH